MQHVTVPRATWDAMREALKETESRLELLVERDQHKLLDVVARDKAREALTAAASVSHPKPETAPPPEGGAITSESAANAVSEQAPKFVMVGDTLNVQLQGGTFSAKEALDALNHSLPFAITEPQAQGESSEHQYAKHLCIEMARKHYPEAAQFKPQDDLLGILTQIDNMAAGLVRPQATEPAGYMLVPVELTPEMLRAIQLKSAIGAEIAANWTGSYECFQELYSVAIAAAPEAKQ